MDWIEVNGATLRYDVQGSGPRTIVLVHEMGGTLESWDEVVPRVVASGRRVIRYDTRGAGLSSKIRGTGSIEAMADDVAALLDALTISNPVAIAGIAVGGAIAIKFAARHTARTSALIPMGPATGIPAERRAATLAAADAIERDGMRASVEAGMAATYPERLRTDPARFARVRAQRMGNDPASYAAIFRMLAGLDMTEDLASIRCPTLVLAGTMDGLRPPAVSEPVANAIRGARFKALETAHFMASQTPELVAGALLEFLDKTGA